MIHWNPFLIITTVMVKGLIIGALLIGVAEASLVQALIVAIASAFVNGIMLLIVGLVVNKHTGAKVEEVKKKVEHVEREVTDA